MTDFHIGSIPAHAGEPDFPSASSAVFTVYPRACGEPLGRRTALRSCTGSIPAHAGEPPGGCLRRVGAGVYPRACGGTSAGLRPRSCLEGLSPRMRGNRRAPRHGRRETGSIPAHAGEPTRTPSCRSGPRVYPRACGGTLTLRTPSEVDTGLSPRMRGNHIAGDVQIAFVGSIPAHAGEPSSQREASRISGVYPRACGGTCLLITMSTLPTGLSPRMRGNHSPVAMGRMSMGSIPAHAGEPTSDFWPTPWNRVYPRACGGTTEIEQYADRITGLSPRMRGNQGLQPRPEAQVGSIPAHAGEPARLAGTPSGRRVYPRACGGTLEVDELLAIAPGLSPRMRGNHRNQHGRLMMHGSIPAHAGEPCPDLPATCTTRVYPRACGGTTGRQGVLVLELGLSPRMRGNRYWDALGIPGSGSIPAHAGEPTPAAPFGAS